MAYFPDCVLSYAFTLCALNKKTSTLSHSNMVTRILNKQQIKLGSENLVVLKKKIRPLKRQSEVGLKKISTV